MKIFIGPWETAGYYKGLSQGMLELGENVTFVLFHDHPFAYGGETHRPVAIRLARRIARLRPDVLSGFVSKFTWWLLTLVREVLLTTWSLIPIFRCDAFIFGTGNSFWRKNLDLNLLFFLKKKVVLHVAHGGELRPPYMDGSYQSKDGTFEPTAYFSRKLASEYQKKIRRIEKFNFTVIGSPMSSSQFATKAMVNIFNIGQPSHLEAKSARRPAAQRDQSQQRRVRALHAPSHPIAKGTFIIREALAKLASEGIEIEFKEVIGQPHSAVNDALVWCDFVIDQVYSDTPLAGLGLEAAMLGKPSVVSGFGLNRLIDSYPRIDFPVSLMSDPSNLETSIRKLAIDKNFRLQLGIAAHRFAQTHWGPRVVAERFLMLIENRAPEHWNFVPDEFHYFEGYGQDVSKTVARIEKLISQFGISSLQLDHKPAFRDELLKWTFANGRKSN